MKTFAAVLATVLGVVAVGSGAARAASAGLRDTGCSGSPNNFTPYEGALNLTQKVTNGAGYTYAPEGFSPPLNVFHVTGSAYDMGKAYGELAKDQIAVMLPETWEYMAQTINSSIGWLPEPIRKIIETDGVEAALNLTIDLTRPHTPQHFIDTLQGFADGSGQSMHELWQVTLIPELIKASCTIVSGWGKATSDNGLVQLRLLDWGTDGPFQQFPTVLCYHPTGGGADDDENGSPGHSFCALTWSGLVGAITGVSSAGIGVQEKVWINYDGFQRADGYPFHFLMQDILQFDTCIDDALSRVASANRTCSIFLGIGSANENTAKTLHYASEYINIYNPTNYPTAPNGMHKSFEDLLYTDMHTQPSAHPCLPNLMSQYYGKLDGLSGIAVAALEGSGNMHAAVADWSANKWYVSNATPQSKSGTIIPAYARQFLNLDMKTQLFDPSLATP